MVPGLFMALEKLNRVSPRSSEPSQEQVLRELKSPDIHHLARDITTGSSKPCNDVLA